MKAQRIRVQPRGATPDDRRAVIAGWLGSDSQSTYLWLGYRDKSGHEVCTGILDGAPLYRLAKAIVRRFEGHARDGGSEK